MERFVFDRNYDAFFHQQLTITHDLKDFLETNQCGYTPKEPQFRDQNSSFPLNVHRNTTQTFRA